MDLETICNKIGAEILGNPGTRVRCIHPSLAMPNGKGSKNCIFNVIKTLKEENTHLLQVAMDGKLIGNFLPERFIKI